MAHNEYDEDLDYELTSIAMEAQSMLKHAETDIDFVLEDIEAIVIKKNQSDLMIKFEEAFGGTENETTTTKPLEYENTTIKLNESNVSIQPTIVKPPVSPNKSIATPNEIVKYLFGKKIKFKIY